MHQIIDKVLAKTKSVDIRDDCNYLNIPLRHIEVWANLLSGLAGDATGQIVDVGTNTGISALALAYGAFIRGAHTFPYLEPVVSLDVDPIKTQFVQELAQEVGFDHVRCYTDTTANVSKYIKDKTLGLAVIDGDHSYAGCYADLNNLAPLLCPYGRMILHDWPVPLAGWEDRMAENGVAHACYNFLKHNPPFQMVYMGHSVVVIGRYASDAWDTERALFNIGA